MSAKPTATRASERRWTLQDAARQDLSYIAARTVMWQFTQRDELPPGDLDRETLDRISWRARHGYGL